MYYGFMALIISSMAPFEPENISKHTIIPHNAQTPSTPFQVSFASVSQS